MIPTESVYLSCDQRILKTGDITQIKADILPANADDITFHWESSDTSVATVDENGNVDAVANGKVYIGLVSDSDLLAESWILLKIE